MLPSAPLAQQPVDATLANVTTQPRASWRTRRRAVAAIIVLGAIAAFGASVMRDGRGESSDLDPRLVWVRPFSNETGMPELERLGNMAADWISQGLAETGVVRVLATMPMRANAEINPAIAPASSSSIRQAGTTVSGSFYSIGDSVSFQVQVLESASGEVLASVGPVLASARDPRAGVEDLRQRTTGALASAVDPLLALVGGGNGATAQLRGIPTLRPRVRRLLRCLCLRRGRGPIPHCSRLLPSSGRRLFGTCQRQWDTLRD